MQQSQKHSIFELPETDHLNSHSSSQMGPLSGNQDNVSRGSLLKSYADSIARDSFEQAAFGDKPTSYLDLVAKALEQDDPERTPKEEPSWW